ncbi:MAG: recombinase family protein [Candidatus Peribacteraceae bacterium]|nr:recombinase family protein [Candidatus Peribacteraceae bacterium]
MSEKRTLNLSNVLKLHERIEPNGYVLYLRKSTPQKRGKKEEEEKLMPVDRVSIEQQRTACMAQMKDKGMKIVKTFEEEVSAKIPGRREEYRKMMQYFKDNKAKRLGVYAWAPDRLTRNALEAGELIQAHLDGEILDFGFATYYFHQSGSGVEQLMNEFARSMGYSLRLSESVKRGMQDKYHLGKEWQFPDKFGYKRKLINNADGTTTRINFLIPHEGNGKLMGEFDVVRLAFRLRIQGLTYREIVEAINDAGFITKRGTRGNMSISWLAGGSKDKIGILHDTVYYGLAHSKWGDIDLRENDRKIDGGTLSFTPAISEEDFLLCQRVNDKRGKPRARTHENLPFRGMIRCGNCGQKIIPQTQGKELVYYYCMNRSCSSSKSHAQKPSRATKNGMTGKQLFANVEKIFEGLKLGKRELTLYLLRLEQSNAYLKEIRERDLRSIAAQVGYVDSEIREEGDDLKKALIQLHDLNRADSAKEIMEAHDRKVQLLQKRREELREKENMIKKSNEAWTQDLAEWLEHSRKAHDYWKLATLAEKKSLAEKVFLELTIKDGELASYRLDETFDAQKKTDFSYDGGRGWN